MQKLPEGIDLPLSSMGSLPKDEVLLECQIDLAWCTTLPSAHRAFVFWVDCEYSDKVDRHYVYVFRDTRFDWAYKKMKTENSLVRPILEDADWVYVVDSSLETGKPIRARKVLWADLDLSVMPTEDARFDMPFPPEEGDDATPSST